MCNGYDLGGVRESVESSDILARYISSDSSCRNIVSLLPLYELCSQIAGKCSKSIVGACSSRCRHLFPPLASLLAMALQQSLFHRYWAVAGHLLEVT